MKINFNNKKTTNKDAIITIISICIWGFITIMYSQFALAFAVILLWMGLTFIEIEITK